MRMDGRATVASLGDDEHEQRPGERGPPPVVAAQQLLGRVKTESSEAPLPLPGLCVTALKLRIDQQTADRDKASGAWVETGLVFTTRHGTPIEPNNFDRSFNRRITTAGVDDAPVPDRYDA